VTPFRADPRAGTITGVTAKAYLPLALLGFACARVEQPGEEDPRPLHERPYELFVGRAPEADLTVALAVLDGEVIGYSCGGDATFATRSRWFCGPDGSGPGGVGLRIFRDDWVLEGTFSEDGMSGTLLQVDREPIAFLAERQDERSRADLYVVDSVGECSTGVIALDPGPGREPEVTGASCVEGIYGQVTPIHPLDWGGDSLRIDLGVPGSAVATASRVRFGDPNEDPGP
jgi:hypothetical protein